MITAYIADQGCLRPAGDEPLDAPGVAWVDLEMAPVTFVLSPERLITVRYHGPRPFRIVPAHANRGAKERARP